MMSATFQCRTDDPCDHPESGDVLDQVEVAQGGASSREKTLVGKQPVATERRVETPPDDNDQAQPS
jgi:hypothetical protein